MAGGLERQLVRVASQLSESEFKVLIFSYDNEPSFSFYKIPDNVLWIKCGDGLLPHTSANLMERFKQIYNFRKILIKKFNNTFSNISSWHISKIISSMFIFTNYKNCI